MLGGAIIGQGTYGCAVRPPFLCHGQARASRKDQGKVGKVTLESDAETEREISKVLRKEKLWKNYFILVEDKECQPIKEKHLEDWSGCTVFKQHKPKELRQVISPFGGKSFTTLSNFDLKSPKFKFLKFVTHILEAGALLALRNVCHFDIHKGNILIDKYNVPRLIDFGMSFQGRKIDSDILNDRWKIFDPQYDSEPPEVTIITGVRKGMKLEEAVHLTTLKKPIFKQTVKEHWSKYDTIEKELLKFFKYSISYKNSDWTSFFRIYWPKFDAFAIGALIAYLYEFNVLSNEFTSVGQTIQLSDIIRKLIDPNPQTRYDCVEALSMWDPDNAALSRGKLWIQQRKSERDSFYARHRYIR